MINTAEIMVVEQIPIIKQQLEAFKEELTERVSYVSSLTVTDSNIKDMKKELADIRKLKAELESRRKEVKKQVLAPYEEFELFYKGFAVEPLDFAIRTLDSQIKANEKKRIDEKTSKLKSYFEEAKQALGVDWVTFEQMGLKVIQSTSESKYKEQIMEWLSHILDEVEIISKHADKDEIFVEYKNCLNLKAAISTVEARHKALEAEKLKREQQEETRAQRQAEIERTQQIIREAASMQPIEEVQEEKIYTLNFKITGTKEQLKNVVPQIKTFLNELKAQKGIESYE